MICSVLSVSVRAVMFGCAFGLNQTMELRMRRLRTLLEDEAELVDVVERPEDEDVAVRLDDAAHLRQPADVELEELVRG